MSTGKKAGPPPAGAKKAASTSGDVADMPTLSVRFALYVFMRSGFQIETDATGYAEAERISVERIHAFISGLGGNVEAASWQRRLLWELAQAEAAFERGEKDLSLWIVRAVYRQCMRIGFGDSVLPHVEKVLKQKFDGAEGGRKGAKSRAKLKMPPDQLRQELAKLMAGGDDKNTAKQKLRTKYDCSIQALNTKLRQP